MRQDLVLLCVDNRRTPHQRGDEGGDDGSVHTCDWYVCREGCLLDSLTLHGQPKVIYMYLISDRNLGPGELRIQ